jgi:hypothetical protein
MKKYITLLLPIIFFAACKNTDGGDEKLATKVTSLQKELDNQKDRQQIVDLAYRFSDAVMRSDSVAFSGVWDDDAVWIIKQPLYSKLVGRENIIKEFLPRMKALDYFINLPANYIINIDGDKASAMFYILEAGQFTAGKRGYYNYAVYKDTLIKKNNAWYFKSRDYHFIYLDNSPMKGIPVVPPFTLLR